MSKHVVFYDTSCYYEVPDLEILCVEDSVDVEQLYKEYRKWYNYLEGRRECFSSWCKNNNYLKESETKIEIVEV